MQASKIKRESARLKKAEYKWMVVSNKNSNMLTGVKFLIFGLSGFETEYKCKNYFCHKCCIMKK